MSRAPATAPPATTPITTAQRRKARTATAGYLRLPRARLIVAALLGIFVLVIAACEGGNDTGATATAGAGGEPGPQVPRPPREGDPRPFKMGFSSLPPEQTTNAYINAIATAAQYGELLLIHRTPSWDDFLPGSAISENTARLTTLERDLVDQYEHMELFFAIDPTDGAVQRTRVANLPSSIDPATGFLDEGLRQAFVAYTAYVVRNYEPQYLALGVEVNMLRDRAPEQYEAFLSLYNEAYEAAKAANPETKVFPTFQLEDLEGSLDRAHPPQWDILDDFEGRMDVLAISTYPFLSDIQSAADLRPDYYTQLRLHFDGEIIIAEAGYTSGPIEGRNAVGTEQDQAAFLQRLLSDAETNEFGAVVWFAALDPVFVTEGPNAVLRNIGLRHANGANKEAWPIWEATALRPVE